MELGATSIPIPELLKPKFDTFWIVSCCNQKILMILCPERQF